MERIFLLLAAAAGFLGVAIGAFGAHALKSRVTPDMLAIFQVGVQYHLIHALALVAAAFAAGRFACVFSHAAGYAFVLGIVLFSGSLYALALTEIRGLGAITPFGGLAFLVGWGCLAAAACSAGPS